MGEVAVFYDAEEAMVARGYLRSHGLDATLPDEQALSVMPEMRVGLGGYRLLVPDDEAAQARRLLREVREENPAPSCRQCGARALRRKRHWWVPLLLYWLFGPLFPFAPARGELQCRRCGCIQPEPDENALTESPA